ncbi:MAG: acyl--CoA ligase [Acidimicrobiaceae bacterium]|nr:acyl--CoA ligase [Acidimicrobiaceae bacterium]
MSVGATISSVDTLGHLMSQVASRYAERVMVEEIDGQQFTFSQAEELVERLSNGVAKEVLPGQRVVISLANGYDLFFACLGVARAGAVAVPLSDQLTKIEVDRIIKECEPALVVRDLAQIYGDLGEPETQIDRHSTAAIFYTSGTTGRPKGVELSHKALLDRLNLMGVIGLVGPQSAAFGLPLSHLMGFIFALSMAMAGYKVYFFPKFDPKAVLDIIEQRRPQIFAGVPAMYRLLLEAGAENRRLNSINVWYSSADAMPTDLARKFQDFGSATSFGYSSSFGSAAFIEGYGMVELGGAVATRMFPSMPFKSTAIPAVFRELLDNAGIGIPFGGAELKVSDENGSEVTPGTVGELWVRNEGSLKGYFKDKNATDAILANDGWVRTGDLARRGPFGTVYFVGRAKDVIKSGGYSVYAREVEAVLEDHPDVAEASVLGIEDEKLGEVPVAAVRLMPRSRVSVAEIANWCQDNLAHYKVPRQIKIVSVLPRTDTAKVKREQLRELFEPGT